MMTMGAPVTAKATRTCLRADKARLRVFLAEDAASSCCLWQLPAWQAVWLYRWSHFHFVNGRRLIGRALWHLNLLLTGADISPMGDFGPGLVILCPLCVVMLGKSGANLTVHGHGGMGGGISAKDIGAGPGLPVMGDNVSLHFCAFVLGPVLIGSGAVIGPRCVVTRDVPQGGVLETAEPRVVRLADKSGEMADD